VDGKAFSGQKVPSLEFDELFNVYGVICNRFTGQGELAENGLFFIRRMFSTRMFCHEQELNQLEQLFGQMMLEGAVLNLQGDILSLRQGGRELRYKRGNAER